MENIKNKTCTDCNDKAYRVLDTIILINGKVIKQVKKLICEFHYNELIKDN